MSYTGSPSSEPQKVGVAITDIATGLYSVIAIQSALIARQNTGKGQHIDMSLLDVSVALSANQGMNYLATGRAPIRRGNDHPNIVPYRAFRLKLTAGLFWRLAMTGSLPTCVRSCTAPIYPKTHDLPRIRRGWKTVRL